MANSVLVDADYAQHEVRLYSMLSRDMNGDRILSPLEQMAADLVALGLFMEVLAATPLLDLGALGGWNASFEWGPTFHRSYVEKPDGSELEWSYHEYPQRDEKQASYSLAKEQYNAHLTEFCLIALFVASWYSTVQDERLTLGRSWQDGQEATHS